MVDEGDRRLSTVLTVLESLRRSVSSLSVTTMHTLRATLLLHAVLAGLQLATQGRIDLNLEIHLHLPPKYWDKRHAHHAWLTRNRFITPVKI